MLCRATFGHDTGTLIKRDCAAPKFSAPQSRRAVMRNPILLLSALLILLAVLAGAAIPLVDTLMQQWVVADIGNGGVASLLERRIEDSREYIFLVVAALMGIVALAAATVAQWTRRARPALLRGSGETDRATSTVALKTRSRVSSTEDVRTLLRDLAADDRS